ncbi:LOW QUALITY PROTEIN: paraneoplastic antigen-like protein 8B [Callospermophilus lateralis]
MAMLLGQDCGGLDMDVHSLLVTWVPEGLEQADKALLKPTVLLGRFRLSRGSAQRKEQEAKATLVESVEDTGHAAIPREMGKEQVWRVLCEDQAQDTGVRQMQLLLQDERQSQEGLHPQTGVQWICLNTKEDNSRVPDLVALLAVRDMPEEELGQDILGSRLW